MFHSNDLVLRKLAEKDLPLLLHLKQESWFGTHRVSIVNGSDQLRWFQGLDSDPHCPANLVLIAELEKDVSGPVGIFKVAAVDYVSRVADVGWDVFADQRGKGLGKKLVCAGVSFCVSILNLRRLNAEILESNHASKSCARSAGFEKEGCKRSCIYKEGKYIDSEVWGYVR